MSEIEFIYNGQSLIIQCYLEDKIEEICQKFSTKIQKHLNELYFLYEGNQLNMNSKLNQIKSKSEKIKILVYDNSFTEKLLLNFNLNDSNNNIYDITLDLSLNFDIKAEYKDSFPKKIYKNIFTLDELKKKSKFFKMYDNVRECYEDIKSLLDQKAFFIVLKDKSVIFGIKKQFGIANDIYFPLKEESLDLNNLNNIISELCIKYTNLENKNIILEKSNSELKINYINLEKKNKELEKKVKELEIKNANLEVKVNKLYEKLKKDIEKKSSKFQFLFNDSIKDIDLIYNDGLDRNTFFEKCAGKNNLLLLVKDDKGNEFGGYMSSKLLKNEKNKELTIKDKNAFIFNLQNKKVFKVIKEDNAINIKDNYLICFGENNKGNDFFIRDDKNSFLRSGMNRTDSYGDKDHETTNGQSQFSISEFKVYNLSF